MRTNSRIIYGPIYALLFLLTSLTPASAFNPNPPAAPVRLIFIHHSTGENWLADANGRLGISLRNNNYFVSDTNYGWGPDSIGDTTDIGHWWNWFRGPNSTTYLPALYSEGGKHSAYSRLSSAPSGKNQIIMFKSCFPNSALQGSPSDPVPPIGSNPLRGEDSSSVNHTVANAKGIYIDLLEYFGTRQDRLFIVVTAPPLSDPTYAANARAFNQWLTNTWLKDYPHNNVAVFDFYNLLTTNNGGPNINDLRKETGNHHRLWDNVIQHRTDGDDDPSPNTLEYPSGDDHPSQAGNRKAAAEFAELLNIYYHCWKGTGDCPPYGDSNATSLQAKAVSPSQVMLSWRNRTNGETGFRIERKTGNCSSGAAWSLLDTAGKNEEIYIDTTASAGSTYSYRARAFKGAANYAYSNCSSAATGAAGTPSAVEDLKAVSVSSSMIRLTWTDTSGSTDNFRIYRKKGSNAWALIHTTAGAGTLQFDDTNAAGNPAVTGYSYYVSACNASGCSPTSAIAAVPFRPSALTATADFNNQLSLSWQENSNSETGFQIFRKSGACSSAGAWTELIALNANTSFFVNTGLATGTTYSYKVRAFIRSDVQPYADGYSSWSSCSEATVQ